MRDPGYPRRGKRRFDDDDQPLFAKRRTGRPRLKPLEVIDATDGLADGERWSTWDQSAPSQRGPRPYPPWLVTDLAAADTDLGVIKTGKEADVHLVRRAVPGTDRSCLLAAKRYRPAEHRMFHRDDEYTDGRRVRESRTNRAMASRSRVGRQMLAELWTNAEFTAIARLCRSGVPVPYPVQVLGTELLLEFVGEPDGTAAPRLAELRPRGAELAGLWEQLVAALTTMAGLGLAHGDLSAYNLLVHRGRLVIIDLPQVIDVIAHPRGGYFLDRDAANVAAWFAARGLDRGSTAPASAASAVPDPPALAAHLRSEARLRDGNSIDGPLTSF